MKEFSTLVSFSTFYDMTNFLETIFSFFLGDTSGLFIVQRMRMKTDENNSRRHEKFGERSSEEWETRRIIK